MDGDSVTISAQISPQSNFIKFNEATKNLDISIEALFEEARKAKKLFEVTLTATDSNSEPRSTVYSFKLKVPQMSDEDIGAFYAGLIYQRVDGEEDAKSAVELPDISSIHISKSALVTLTFTQVLLTKDPALIT